MGTASQQLFNDITTGLWDVLERYRAQAAGVLAGLAAEPGFGGTVLDQRLLQAIKPDDVAAGDPGVAALIHGLHQILSDPAGGPPVTLHGFDPGAGQARGLAAVMVTPAPAATFVAALTGAGPTGLAFEFAVVGAGAFGPATLPLSNSWSLDVSGNAGGGGRLQFPRGGTPSVLDGLAPISVTLTLRHASGGGTIAIGPDSGPQVTFASVAVGATTGSDSAGNPEVTFTISLPDAHLALVTDVLAVLLGNSLSMPIALNLSADPEQGFNIQGGGVRTSVPVNVSLPGIDISAVDLAIASTGDRVEFDFGITFTGGLPGIPLTMTVDGLGAGFPILAGTTGLGLDPAGTHPVLPSGFGLDLDLPVVSGGGFLMTTGDGGFGGVLDLSLLELSIDAFGLLQLPENGKPLSFVAIISVEFPLPGIELGFGFSLNGVGGIVAVNRRLDVPSLQAAVVDGSAKRLLFPVDPASHGPAIIATLGKVFPAADGHVVVGPMLEVDWGGRILSMIVAVVVDLPNPLQFVIIGRITLALPDPAVPLVLIQATFVGAFEISPVQSVSLLASLDGSSIVGMPLNGDIFFLLQGGDDAEFVLTAGGFHPKYKPPQGVPAKLHRLQLDITPPGFPGLRSEAYFAVTTNSVQFGAKLELCDEIGGCGVDGWFSFDALFQWDPVFSFSIHASAGIAVQVFGETLMGVNMDLTLEGPSPWHVHGTGSVDLFLFSASFDFDVKWGDAPPPLGPAPDLAPVLAAALAKPGAWIGKAPTDEQPMVSLSPDAKKLESSGQSVHPLGRVAVRERTVPFDIQISRFQQKPIPAQTWSIVSAELASAVPASLGAAIQDKFAPGQFLDLTQDEQLARPAFEQMNSGVTMTPADVINSDLRPVNTDFEVQLVPDIELGVLDNLFVHLLAESFLGIADVHTMTSLWSPPNLEKITVLADHPVTVATTDTMTEQPVFATPGGFTATLQAAQAKFGSVGQGASVQIVEHWEVVAP
ncbi:MAG TPA: DUF6603 domain-containing protein [Bryobacteraceae bacterium]|nr:DUF6603 domain-containing protein [Bryobacteraceae bacterium]